MDGHTRHNIMVTVDASAIGDTEHHCDHNHNGTVSWSVPTPQGLTVYLLGTADDLRSAADRLLRLAHEHDLGVDHE